MIEIQTHFALEYANQVNAILHAYLWPTWFYKMEIYDVPEICTALLITYDGQRDDEFKIYKDVSWEEFLGRMKRVKPDWAHFSLDIMKEFAEDPKRTMVGWEGRTIYFIKSGKDLGYWTRDKAQEDALVLLSGGSRVWGDIIRHRVEHVKELIPVGHEHFR